MDTLGADTPCEHRATDRLHTLETVHFQWAAAPRPFTSRSGHASASSIRLADDESADLELRRVETPAAVRAIPHRCEIDQHEDDDGEDEGQQIHDGTSRDGAGRVVDVKAFVAGVHSLPESRPRHIVFCRYFRVCGAVRRSTLDGDGFHHD